MSDFAFYTYTLEEGKRHLFSKETGKTTLEMSAQIFEQILRMNNDLCLKKKNGESQRLEYKRHEEHDHVFVYELCNRIQTSVKDGHDKNTVESRPGSYIIIDNREGMFQIAIEANNAFGNTEFGYRRVIDMLNEMLDTRLSESGLGISIRGKYDTMTFVEKIYEHKKKKPDDTPKIIQIAFPSPDKVRGLNTTEQQTSVLKDMARIYNLGNAIEAQVKCRYKKDCPPDLFKGELGVVVDACLNNNFDLKVQFWSGKKFETNSEKFVKRPLEEKHIHDFLNGQTCLDFDSDGPDGGVKNSTYDLCVKLDAIRNDLMTCKDGDTVKS